jgi:hypothetical protein
VSRPDGPPKAGRDRRTSAPRAKGERPGVKLYHRLHAKRTPVRLSEMTDTDVLGGLLGSRSIAAKVLSHGDGTLKGLQAVKCADLALSIPGLGYANAARVACLMEASRRLGGTA